MRALQVFEPPDGGVAEQVEQLTAGLASRGHAVEVVGPLEARNARAIASSARYHGLPLQRSYRRPGDDASALAALVRIARRGGFDLLHAHSAKAGVLGRLAAAAAGLPCVYTPHCYPFIGEVSTRRRAFATLVERRLSPLTSTTICVCRYERDEALTRRIAPPDRLAVVHNGVGPCPAVDPDPGIRSFAAGRLLVGTVAVHRRQKGIDRFLRAAREVSAQRADVRFAVVGDGPLLEAHRALAERLSLTGAVAFAPFSPPPARYLRALDVFVLPSRWEAFPIAVLESMSCGTPIIASAVGGTPEALGTEAGVVVRSDDDHAELARAIVGLADSRDRRDAIAAAAAARVSARFTVDQMVEKTLEVYRGALRRRQGERAGDRPPGGASADP